jgi:hypothetical protein
LLGLAEQGLDVKEPNIQLQAQLLALKDAVGAIFQQDTKLNKGVNAFLATLESPSKITGKPHLGGKVGASLFKIALPVKNVPINIFSEFLENLFGVPMGATRAYRARKARLRGEKIKPEQADLIFRNLERGFIGMAAALYGWFNYKNMGGYYHPGEKRDPEDVKWGALRVNLPFLGQKDLPPYLIHNPTMMVAQLFATAHRLWDYANKDDDAGADDFIWAMTQAMGGATEEIPYVREAMDISKLYGVGGRKAANQYIKGIVVPQISQQIAEWMDEDTEGQVTPRETETLKETIESGVPVLRQQLEEGKQK